MINRKSKTLNFIKKFCAVMLCVSSLSLAACGSSTNTADEGKNTNNESTEAASNQTEKEQTTATPSTSTNAVSAEPDFSNAERIYICAIVVSSRDGITQLVDDFGVKKCVKGEQIDLKQYESFNGLKDFVQSTLAQSWNGKRVEAPDNVVTNEVGDGYFKLEASSNKLYLLYLPN